MSTGGQASRIGPYEVLSELGRGGMGVVYRARDTRNGREVALKVGAVQGASTEQQLKRFQREIRIGADLSHPGIVPLLDAGESDEGAAWFAMEMVQGRPLDELAGDEGLEWRQATEIVRDVADALGYAHSKGVLHRDVKPGNILMDHVSGRPRVADFGLARTSRVESKFTRSGEVLGTPAYMPPEQARGDLAALSPASDVWACGCVLYELLTGRQAFEGDGVLAVIAAVIKGGPAPLRGTRPNLPPGLAELVDACLAKDPANRPPDGYALRDDLDRILQGERPLHPPAPPRRPRTLAAGALAAVTAIAGGTWAVWPDGGRAPATPVVDAEAQRLAALGWTLRSSDAAAGAARLGEALSRAPERHDWRLQHGLLCWAAGHNAEAAEAWKQIPSTAAEWPTARLYLALEIEFRRVDDPDSNTEVRPYAAEAAKDPGRIGQVARGLLKYLDGRPGIGFDLVEDIAGWEAAFLRSLCLGTSDPQRGIKEIDRAMESGMVFAWALSNRGFFKFRLGDQDGAMRDYEAALAIDPKLAIALFNRANAKRAAGDSRGAIADYHAGLAIEPHKVAALHNCAGILMALGEYRAAIADLDTLLQSQPKRPVALADRAVAKRALGDAAGAVADCTAALAINPRMPRTLILRGLSKVDLKDIQGAIADFNAALAIDPALPGAFFGRARAKDAAGWWQAAIADYDATIESDPKHAVAFAHRGVAKARLGNPRGALADFNAALELNPKLAFARSGRGAAKNALGDPRGALLDLDAALAMNPTLVKAINDRGVAKQALGDGQGALADYDAALRLEPEYVEALANRGAMYLNQRRFAKAIPDLTKALELAPPNWPYRGPVSRWLARARAGAQAQGR